MNKQIIAAIDIGSSSIRMTIAEVSDLEVNILEELRQPARLGKDTFHKEKILRTTIDDCISILKKYKKLCEEYNVTKIRAVATTAVREAVNVDIFIDNIKTFTDIQVEILSASRETELIYRSLSKDLEEEFKTINAEEYQAIVEIGAGNVEISLFNKECIVFSRSLPIGALKMKQIFSKYSNSEENFLRYLRAMVENELRSLKRNIPYSKITKLYGIGTDLEHLSRIINKQELKVAPVEKDTLSDFCKKIQNYTQEEMIHKLNIPYENAETFYAVSIMFLKIIDFFSCENIYITRVTLRDGLIEDMHQKQNSKTFFTRLEIQLKVSAINIGRTLNFDEKHAIKVLDFALQLFEETKDLHRLGHIEKCYLIVAAILHDVGISISNRSHHKHSFYVINAQDFFYFDDNDKLVIANIARYHRRITPKESHPEYMKLSHTDRMTVMKLAAILRIADSFDNSNLQLIDSINIVREKNEILITAHAETNIFAESYSFKYKRDLFEEFFGLEIKMKTLRESNGEK